MHIPIVYMRFRAVCITILLALLAIILAGCPNNNAHTSAPGDNQKQANSDEEASTLVRFTDVAKEAGLDFTQYHGGCGQRYFAEQVASGATVFDANGDGNLDIYFPQPKPLGPCGKAYKEPLNQKLYLGDGHGHFTLSKNAFKGHETDYGIAAAVGDYDSDGKPDLYVACYGKNTLYRNEGDGTFTDVTKNAKLEVGGLSTGATWFDYDGDGKLDLYVLRYCDWTLATDIPCIGPHGERDVCNPRIYTPSTNKLFHNNGDGTFTDVTSHSGAGPEKRRSLDAAAIDFDADGKLDLFVANDLGPNYLLHNNGDGTFTDVAMQQGVAFGISGASQANMGLAVGDYDETGRPSVCVTTFTNEPFTLYHNDGLVFTDVSEDAGIAEPTRSYLAFGTGFIDTRNSGHLDLFFANGHVSPYAALKDPLHTYKQRNQLFLNTGKGKFAEDLHALPESDMKVHRGTAFGSFSNNGKIDIVVTGNNDKPALLRNDTQAGNWLLVKLTNKWGCSTPVGVRCVATVGGSPAKKLTRWVLGGGSYGGDSDQRLHFGLGRSSQVDSFEIHWMSGKVQTLQNIKANQILTVQEPK
jgi:hypothetical protein